MNFCAVVFLSVSFNLVSGCSQEKPIDEAQVARYEQVYASATMTTEIQNKWARSCALCHVAGEGGAPRTGDTQAWSSRVEQGSAILLTHTLEGLNRMPPLGYCMDCELEDFAAMIKMMTGNVK